MVFKCVRNTKKHCLMSAATPLLGKWFRRVYSKPCFYNSKEPSHGKAHARYSWFAINFLRFRKQRFWRPSWRKTKSQTNEAHEILLFKFNQDGRHDVTCKRSNNVFPQQTNISPQLVHKYWHQRTNVWTQRTSNVVPQRVKNTLPQRANISRFNHRTMFCFNGRLFGLNESTCGWIFCFNEPRIIFCLEGRNLAYGIKVRKDYWNLKHL